MESAAWLQVLEAPWYHRACQWPRWWNLGERIGVVCWTP